MLNSFDLHFSKVFSVFLTHFSKVKTGSLLHFSKVFSTDLTHFSKFFRCCKGTKNVLMAQILQLFIAFFAMVYDDTGPKNIKKRPTASVFFAALP